MLALTGAYRVSIRAGDDSPRQLPWLIPRRRLAHYLAVCSRDGDERIVVDGADHRVPADACYLIPPGVVADIGSALGNRPVWVHFDVLHDPRRGRDDRPGIEIVRPQAAVQPGPVAVWGVDLPALVPSHLAEGFGAGLEAVVARWKQGGAVAVLEAEHRLAGLLLAWVADRRRELGLDGPLPVGERLARAEAVACENLAGFDLRSFAAAAGMSRSRFCLLYRRLRGISPGAFLRRERLRLAEGLLRCDDLDVAAVGRLAGWSDPSVFARAWRAAHGITPGAWRQRTRPS